MDSKRLGGRRCLITGAGRDLGAAIAASLAGHGAAVVLNYNTSRTRAERLCKRLRQAGAEVHALQADLRDAAEIRALVRGAARLLGGIDILVNSAGVFTRSDLKHLDAAGFDRLLALNLKAPVLCARECARLMRGNGRIVNIASLGAFEAWPRYLGYCAAKAGLVSATRTMARALAPRIAVNAVAPGFIDLPRDMTAPERKRIIDRIPAGRLGNYRDVVEAVLFFCTAEYVTGQILVVDGGASLR